MEFILWRHAEAEDSSPDTTRRLTPKGEKQARKIAQWLKERVEKPLRVLASPSVRTQQTATAFTTKFATSEALGVHTSAARILHEIGWPHAEGTTLIVGHQPTLGQLAAKLLTGQEIDWEVKKGAVWWLTTSVAWGEPVTVLRAVITPKDV